jgi:hypothetical protein
VQLTLGLVELAQGRPFSVDPTHAAGLVDRAVEHRVAPLLYQSLLAIPGADKNRLAALDLLVRHRSRLFETELHRVAETAASLGVSIAVLKGQAHAERWFSEDPSVRQFSDLDLFVDPRDAAGLNRLIQALDPNHELGGKAGALMASGVLPDIPIRTSQVLIEIHANPLSLPLSRSQIETLWDSTESWTTNNGLTIRRFDPTVALLHALINSAKDNHAYLLQVIEIGRALEDPAIDWDRFQRIVSGFRWDAIIDDALRYCCATLRIALPPCRLVPKRRDAAVLRRLTPVKDRLGGEATWRKAQRFAKLDMAVPGKRLAAVVGIARRSLSPDELIRAYAPDLRGPYLVRAVRYWVRRQQYVQGKRSSLSDAKTHADK